MTEQEQLVHIEDDAVQIVERAEGETGDGRTLLIRLMRWGEVAEQTEEGYRETFAPGSFAGTDPTRVTIESQRHKGELVGRGVALEEREDGPYLTARISNTSGGNDLLTLIHDGVLRAASVVARLISERRLPGGVIQRTAVELVRVAILERGAYPSAGIVAVRSEPEPEVQEAVVSDEQTPVETPAEESAPITPEPVMAPEPAQEEPVPPSPAPALIERTAPDLIGPAITRLEALEQRMAIIASTPANDRPEVPELFQLGSFTQYVERALDEKVIIPGDRPDPAGMRQAFADFIQRTVADQISSQNAGVSAPGWLTDVKRIVDLGRPSINALGGPQPLPAEGMDLNWPYVSSTNTIIGVQSTQKTEVTSARVDIGKGESAIGTYAGVSDISVQLIKRSRPSYRAIYDRIMLAAWAAVTDNAFVDALFLASTAATYGWDADTTGQNLKDAIFAASVQVETATGLPAEVALVATDVFSQLGRLSQIVPASPPTNPSNASGTLHAGTLNVNVAGLPLVHSRGLATGNVLVTNREAAQWFEDGPFSMTADDASLLGTDVAWYSFGATATFTPAGIVKLFGPGASGS